MRFAAQGVRYRPGLVEIMGRRAEAGCVQLLRGLLASNRQARWRAASVDVWLQNASVNDPYDLAAVEPIFAWAGKTFSVVEAAKFLLTQAAWSDAISNFVDSANPQRLSYQIRQVYRDGWLVAENGHVVVSRDDLRYVAPAVAVRPFAVSE